MSNEELLANGDLAGFVGEFDEPDEVVGVIARDVEWERPVLDRR